MSEDELKYILEALLMTQQGPLSIEQLQQAFDDWNKPSREEIKYALSSLEKDYNHRSIELKCLARGYCFQTKKQYQAWVTRLLVEKPAKYSSAFLETLAIIAYRQPVTRADIEHIRGVSVSTSILKGLLEREWIRVAGHRDVVGKPAVYVTTKQFLDYFNLASLDELPALQQSAVMNE